MPDLPVWRTSVTVNRTVLPLVAMALAVLPVTIYVPPIADLLHVAPPSPDLWAPMAGLAALATLWTEPIKWLRVAVRAGT